MSSVFYDSFIALAIASAAISAIALGFGINHFIISLFMFSIFNKGLAGGKETDNTTA